MPAAVLTPVSFAILLAVTDEPRHGYAIIKQVEADTGGGLRLEAGTLYAAIKRLLDEGLLEPDARARPAGTDSRRRYYRVTVAGRRAVAAECDRMAGLLRLARDKGALAARRGSR